MKLLEKGYSKTSEYHIWRAMLTRCYNKNHPSSKNHGRRGITVCNRWHRFENFYFDMGMRPSTNHCIDRIDNYGNYSPRNCRWATWKEQQNNRRSNVKITFNSETMTISQWGVKLKIGRGIIWKRLNRGWTIEEALTTPSLMPKRIYKFK